MREEAERIKSIVDRYDDDVGRLIDPMFERPVPRVTVYIGYQKFSTITDDTKKTLPPPCI